MPRNLLNLSVEDREKHLGQVYRECEDFREAKEPTWLRIGRQMRMLSDDASPYRSKLISTYLWSAIQSWMSVIEPIFLSSNPVFDLRSPKDEATDRNRSLEKLLTQQVMFQSNFRQAWTRILLEALVFGSSYPWTSWKTRIKQIGPLRQPVLDERGFPRTDEEGRTLVTQGFEKVRTYHAPFLEYVSLWDSFIHPDGQRGFSQRKVTGHELLATSGPAPALYNKGRVERMLKAAAAWLQGRERGKQSEQFAFGDPNTEKRHQIADEAGVEGDHDLFSYLQGYKDDVLSMPFPILHYDDGEFSGTYALNRDGRFYELRFFGGASPDGEGNRMSIVPYSSPGEVFGTSVVEQSMGLLQAHTRFMQLALDGAALSVHPQFSVSQTYDQMVGEVLTGPGAINVVPTSGGEPHDNHLRSMPLPQGWHNAMGFREGMVTPELDQMFAQDDFSRGRFSGGRKTAAEVGNVLQFAQGRLELLAERISEQFGRPLGKKWLCMNVIHMNPADLGKVLGVEGENLQMPTLQETIEEMNVVHRGSVLATSASNRLQRFGQMAGAYFQSLPMLQIPAVQNFMREWFELAGMEGVTKDFPATDDTQLTKLQQMMMESGKNPLALGSQAAESPTDLSSVLSAQGGAEAPPAPGAGLGG